MSSEISDFNSKEGKGNFWLEVWVCFWLEAGVCCWLEALIAFIRFIGFIAFMRPGSAVVEVGYKELKVKTSEQWCEPVISISWRRRRRFFFFASCDLVRLDFFLSPGISEGKKK